MSGDATGSASRALPDVVRVRRALISCFDKTGLVELGRALVAHGVELVSTGSTAATLRGAGIAVAEVSEVTGFPECLDGRVKTLHPAVHAGILADRRRDAHLAELAGLGIDTIDLVVGNLYPFGRTVAAGAAEDEVVEMIDVGGPTMLRAAAKNHAAVTVLVDPAEHALVLDELERLGGTTLATRRRLATTAFRHTAAYDVAIADWFGRDEDPPAWLGIAASRSAVLRYGENPHQVAATYDGPALLAGGASGVASARQLGGKELSYNNLLDADAAWGMVVDLDDAAVVIVKHTNPAGLAVADDLATAYERALEGDPVSAFGGIVATNRRLDGPTARRIVEVFTEVVLAPGYDDDALEALATRPNLRVLELPDADRPSGSRVVRSVGGGLLLQGADDGPEPFDTWRVVTRVAPDAAALADLRLAWIAAKHTKSNAIVLARDGRLVGVGAGQMSRVDSVRLAVERSGGRHEGSVLASDAFFPFRDGPDAAAAAGVRAIVQPGGSVRDEEVIAAADAHGIAMLLTDRRHFRH
ncbi:MAG: phosphoribosylaminoimidazolecarboxamide formyltransferase/IMP cyclohydrolase [Actinomycetota bacterium]|jgi:phosphoribosylaminoimidazolecarboxamide formyltransferase/IMP cyclohydrolase